MVKRIIALCIVFLPFFSFMTCNMSSGDWAAKIDDEVITIDEFYRYYYTQNKMLLNMDKKEIDKMAMDPSMVNHPTINRSKFLDFLISRKLLFQKAMTDDTINKDELTTVVELFKLNGVATYYLSEKLKDEINVTDDEIDRFYNENRRLFKGVPIDDTIINKIKQQIFMQKFEQKSNEFLMNLIAESKVNKEGFKKYLRDKISKESSESSSLQPDVKKTEEPTKK